MALILAVGLVSLLGILASQMAALAMQARAAALPGSPLLAAASGLEYAASRLSGWSPGQAPGEPFSAVDGEGRFPEAARRLRGGLSFGVRAECLEGRLPVNSGALWPDDVFGYYGGGPDHQDATITCHRGLMHALDNLGAIRLPLGGTRRWQAASGANGQGEMFQLSCLGGDLIGSRPAGGYRSPEEVEETLLRLGYSREECGLVLPYLDAGPSSPLPDTARLSSSMATNEEWQDPSDPTRFPRYVPVNAHVASAAVLESLWRYLLAAIGDTVRIAGEAGGWDAPCSRTDGLTFAELGPPGNAPTGGVYLLLYADEARALAEHLIALRGREPLSWRGIALAFAERPADPSQSLFRSDHADLAGSPVLQQAWVQAKADLAFQAVAIDRHPPGTERLGPAPATWLGWGIDRFPDDRFDGQELPDYRGCQQSAICDPEEIKQVLYPPVNGGWGGPHVPYQSYGEAISTQGVTLAPPSRFSVDSRGEAGPQRRKILKGELRTGDRLELACQEDFEALQGGRNLAPLGISIAAGAARDARPGDALPGGSPPVYEDGVRRRYPHVVTLPRENIRGATAATWGPPLWGFSRGQGALALAGVEAGLVGAGARLYWPISEDADFRFNDGGVRRSGPDADTWHERSSSFQGDDPLDPLRRTDSPLPASPYWIYTGSIPETFLWPGMERKAEGQRMRDFSVELRMGPSSTVEMKTPLESGGHQQRLSLNTSRVAREENDIDLPGTSFGLTFRERSRPAPENSVFFLPDKYDPHKSPFNHHVLLNVSTGANATVFRLYVDGDLLTAEGGGQEVVYDHPFTACDTSNPLKRGFLRVTLADEVRIHEGALPDVAFLSGLDRFVRSGTYVSPLYLFDAPARMRQVQWTGLLPPGFPVSCLSVVVEGFSDVHGNDHVFQASLGPSGPPERLPHVPVRSFRYTVAFDVPMSGPGSIPPPLTDSPVFESIWFTFQRRGRAPSWIGVQ